MNNVSITAFGYVNVYSFGLGKRIHKTEEAAKAAGARSRGGKPLATLYVSGSN